MDLSDKIIYAHKGYFDKESTSKYKENSLEVCRIASSKDYIKVIELDVRKSKDRILYCYHGNIFEYFFLLKFRRQFSALQKKYHVSALKDILEAVSQDKVICLDIKDSATTREDILTAFTGKKFREVIIGNKSVAYLRRFHDMPKGFVKMLNGNMLSTFYNLKKLKEDNFKYFEIVFPFLATKNIFKKLKESGLKWVGFPAVIFWSEKSYVRCINKYNIKYIPSYFV